MTGLHVKHIHHSSRNLFERKAEFYPYFKQGFLKKKKPSHCYD